MSIVWRFTRVFALLIAAGGIAAAILATVLAASWTAAASFTSRGDLDARFLSRSTILVATTPPIDPYAELKPSPATYVARAFLDVPSAELDAIAVVTPNAPTSDIVTESLAFQPASATESVTGSIAPTRVASADAAAVMSAIPAETKSIAEKTPKPPKSFAKLDIPTADRLIPLPQAGSRIALYDIEARTVYLPGGERLEAHSGLAFRRDDPRHVSVKNRGPTPPNTYKLTLREQLFHGVRALRLTPTDESKMFGRDGILAHTYMLGRGGDSNGCVSFKDYPRFLRAYLKGDVSHIVVVSRRDAIPSRVASAQAGRGS